VYLLLVGFTHPLLLFSFASPKDKSSKKEKATLNERLRPFKEALRWVRTALIGYMVLVFLA